MTARQGVWTILEVLRWTTTRFEERGMASARLDAELLAAHAFGLSRVQLYTQFDRPLDSVELGTYRGLVKRRQGGEPIAYITGRKEFWSLDLLVDSRTLVPRPETETVVEVARERLPATGPTRLLDVATGSGAIALAVAHTLKSRPEVVVVATDVSADALDVARANAERLGLTVTFFQGTLLEPLDGQAPFDVITANLPYIPTADIEGLSADVRSEPRLALDGGNDGLDLIRRLVKSAPPLLTTQGSLVLEIGAGQASAVAQLCNDAGLADVEPRRDLAGIDRVVVARRKGI